MCFVVLNLVMEPVSSSEYCGSACHEMNTAYQSWELSPHGANKNGIRVECVDCHLRPKDEFFRHIVDKAYAGIKDMYKHHFGGEYDVEKTRAKVLEHLPDERCSHCHNNLLVKPSSSKARLAHIEILEPVDEPVKKCSECHEQTGHERTSKLFAP